MSSNGPRSPRKYFSRTFFEDFEDSGNYAWEELPTSTIIKSFRKVFPKEKWDELTGDTDETNDFEGFNESDFQHCPPSDNLGSHRGDIGGQIINVHFQSEIDEIVGLLNICQKDVILHREHFVEDVL